MFAMLSEGTGDKKVYGMEDWTGYTHERIDLMKFVAERQIPNTVVLTGDMHSNWVNDIRVDDRKDGRTDCRDGIRGHIDLKRRRRQRQGRPRADDPF